MTKYFTNLAKDINLEIYEAQWNLNKINAKKSMPRDMIKLLKTNKQKSLKATRENWNIYIYRETMLNDGRFLIRVQLAVGQF